MKGIYATIKQLFKELDKITLAICLSASVISCICIYSFHETGAIASNRMLLIQVIAVILGVITAFCISRIDYIMMANLWKIYVPIAVFLVILTYFIGVGPEAADDKAWLDLGFTTLQPSELLKLTFVFTFSLHISKVSDKINQLRPFLLLCLHGAAPTTLVMFQGDFGSALVFLAIFIFMMFSAGLSIKLICVGLVGAIISAPLIWYFVLPNYLQERFIVAQQPENFLKGSGLGWQQYKGRIALGSGQLYGRGPLNDSLYQVPKAYNDFIFSYIGQTLGFVGTIITLLIITLLCVKILATAKMSKDKLGTYICVGVFAIFMFQSIINIGMVLCVLPVIGITLPLFSAGGTSVVVSYMAIGMVLSVYRVNKKEMMFD